MPSQPSLKYNGEELKNGYKNIKTNNTQDRDIQFRVLSFNFNILPFGCGGFQNERITAFLERTGQYDILMFQEVYAASVLPYFVQKHVCYKKRLLDELKKRGFLHYVISKQPSYSTILSHNVLSDNGLIIASRFPIGQSGSYTFRCNARNEQSVRRGCLFAEIMVPTGEGESEPVIFFNIHLHPEEGAISASAQIMETRQFIQSVLGHLNSDQEEASKIPFIIAGDFNINGIDLHNVEQPTKKLNDLMHELQPLSGGLNEAIFQTLGYHPPTRPSKLFFPTQSKLHRNSITPQRQDYFFINTSVNVREARIRKFVANSIQPYVYLSDHFGLSVTLSVNSTGRKACQETLTRKLLKASVAVEAVHEHSNPFSSIKVEIALLIMLIASTVYFNWSSLLGLAALWVLLWWSSSPIRVLRNERRFATVTAAVVEGKEEIILNQPSEYEILRGVNSLAELWQRSVQAYAALPCLGQYNYNNNSNNNMNMHNINMNNDGAGWWSYGQVEGRVREVGAGLWALGLTPGDVIGVDCPASSRGVVLELACATYGFTTLPLVGKSSTIQTLIDQYNVKIVFAGRSTVASFLTCRSRNLETIVYMHNFSDAADDGVARDVGISLISYDEVCLKGRLHFTPPPSQINGDTIFSLIVDNKTTYENLQAIRITHADILRSIRTLVSTSVLPVSRQKHLFLLFTPFSATFNRIFTLGLFAHGSSVATSDTMSQRVFETFKPTIMIANSSLFAMSEIQLRRANERYGKIYTWLFEKVYQFRSVLINVHCRDSSVLRFIFFHSIQRQLGGNIEKIILCSSEESMSYRLQEHLSVCYAPCLREVFFLPSEGVFCIDGIPAPGLHVQIEPFDETSKKAKIGQLILTRKDEEKHILPIAATWNDDRTLRLMGPTNGVLLPFESEYVVAAELERTFAQSRYVNDIFLYAKPSHSIIAIVTPNRDTIEFEWQQRHQQYSDGEDDITVNWTELAREASNILLKDFRRIAEINGLPVSHIPEFVHIHPHTFKEHENFLTPYAGIRRKYVALYFKSVIDRFYSTTNSTISTPPLNFNINNEENSFKRKSPDKQFSLRVPMAIDIGGTFAKIVYIEPPGISHIPDFVVHEASSLSDTLAMRSFQFFNKIEDAEQELSSNPSSKVGTVRFAKLPSKRIPDFITYLSEIKVLDLFAQPYRDNVRATGGGAFKYASIAKNKLNTKFEVMREMDAVVHGLGLVIRLAPDSIFTVDPPTGIHYPHQLKGLPGEALLPYPCLLVNIGSGISIIKILGPDGSHVRVGGSPIGGATFWGLVRTMTDITSWEEVMEIMRLDGPGDNKNVDLLVGDIYGFNAKDLPAMLSVDTVASTFGKLGTERFYEVMAGMKRTKSISSDEGGDALSPMSPKVISSPSIGFPKEKKKPSAIDIVRSLLNMISSNITQLAYLHSKVQNVPNIFFAGGFVRNNPIIWSHISSALQYWSKGESFAHFLEHDGYLGALGSATMMGNTETS